MRALDPLPIRLYKQVFESIRKSPILCGFNFLQPADTDRYENANGLLDCFDDLKPTVDPAEYSRLLADAVLAADLPRRTFFEGETVTIPIWPSNYAGGLAKASCRWELISADNRTVKLSGQLDRLDLPAGLTLCWRLWN